MSVHFLPVEVQSRLRSGIAITCPRQCVEELVLNALDAGATCVAVRVNFDLMKIQVIDNGSGISHDQLELVGERYATSKCHSLSDLDKLEYYGFRGEALASIRDVSGVLEIVTRSKRDETTLCKIFNRGKRLQLKESVTRRPSVGTTCTVHSFLHNLPVRRQNVRAALDLDDIRTRVESIALIHPRVKFSLRNDATGAMCVQTERCDSVLTSFCNLFGEIRTEHLRSVRKRVKRVSVEGYVSEEGAHDKHLQFVYVNKRLVLTSKLRRIVNSCCSRYLSSCKGTRRHAVYVLNVSCPLTDLDVRFEPSKTLVEFADWDSVTRCVERAVDEVWSDPEAMSDPQEVQRPVAVAVEKRIEMRELRSALTSVPAKRKKSECATPPNCVTPPNCAEPVPGPRRKLKLKDLAAHLVVTSLGDYVRKLNGEPVREKIAPSLKKFVYEPKKMAPNPDGTPLIAPSLKKFVYEPKNMAPSPEETPQIAPSLKKFVREPGKMAPSPEETPQIAPSLKKFVYRPKKMAPSLEETPERLTTTPPSRILSNCRNRVNRLREKMDRAKSRRVESPEQELQSTPVVGRSVESWRVESPDEELQSTPVVGRSAESCAEPCATSESTFSNLLQEFATENVEMAVVERRNEFNDPNWIARTDSESNKTVVERRNEFNDPNWIARTDSESNKTVVERRNEFNDPNKTVVERRNEFNDPNKTVVERRNEFNDPNWIARTDSESNKTVYVHKITGNSTYSPPVVPNIAENAENAEKLENPDRSLEFASTIYLGSAATAFNSRRTSVRTTKSLDKWRDRESTLLADLLGDVDGVPARSSSPISVYDLIHPYKFSREMLDDLRVIRQVDRKFIACKLARGLIVLFDQHAVHERIRLEQLQAEMDAGNEEVKVKRVSVEPPMDLTMRPDEIGIVGAFLPVFAQWGFELSVDAEERRVRIRTMPLVLVERRSVLRDAIEAVFRDVIQELRNSGTCSTMPRSLLSILHSLACKSAVKFGDFLDTSECEELMLLLRECRLPFQCAHGRPAIAPLLDLNLLTQFRQIKRKRRPRLWKLQLKYDYTTRE